MARTASSFKRRPSRFKPNPTVLILCEDSQSGKTYLEDARLHFRALAIVEIAHCGNTDPLGIVNEAIRRRRQFDEVFCAIDRDRHANFDEALRIAGGYPNVTPIVSYPCFEYWLLLHFRYTDRPYVEQGRLSPADVLIRELRGCPGFEDYAKGEKSSPFNRLAGDPLQAARRWGPRTRTDAETRGNLNPSTSLDLLIDKLEALGEPESLA